MPQALTDSLSRFTLSTLHNIFESKMSTEIDKTTIVSPSNGASDEPSATKHATITAPVDDTTPPSYVPARKKKQLSDYLTKNAPTMKKAKTKSRPYVCSDDAQACSSRDMSGRPCLLCNLRDPMKMQSFIDHIMGKRHRIADHKRALTKKQKEDRDARTLHVKGFDKRTLPEELCGLFWSYGMVDIQVSPKHVFIEFANKDDALLAVSSKVQTGSGNRLITSMRSMRSHCDDKMADEPMEFFLSPAIRKLISVVPRSAEEVQEYVDRLLNDVQMRPDEYEGRQYVRDRIEHFLRLEFQNVKCHVFGSSGNNLGFHGADVDLYAALGYDPYDTPRATDGEAAAAKLTYYLAKHLRRQHWITGVEAIPKARVPIIKFQQAGVAVDLSFRNGMPVQNTALIRLYTYVHPLVRPYMMVVRFWAKMQRLAGGGQPNILLTNYALTMLMAFVIMRDRGMLPTLSELRAYPYKRIIINGWNCGFGEDTSKYSNKVHNCSVLQLVHEFFTYYANLDMAEWVICPLRGILIQRDAIAEKKISILGREMQDYVNAPGNLQHDTPLCVQDPFDLTHNVTRGLRKIALERFQLLCRQSAIITQNIMDLKISLATLFQPIEVTDDMYDMDDSPADVSNEGAENVTGNDEDVIVLDDDVDTTQDIVILEEVQQVLKRHGEMKQLYNGKQSPIHFTTEEDVVAPGTVVKYTSGAHNQLKGTKRTSDGPPTSLTSAEVALCSSVELDSPTVYQLRLNPDIVYKLGPDTGALALSPTQTHTQESAKRLALDIITFMFNKVYAVALTKTDISNESPSKRIKNCSAAVGSEKSLNCYAKLNVVFKYDLKQGKAHIRAVNTPQTLDKVSPFTLERSMAQRQLRLIDQGQQKFGEILNPEKKFNFFICHDVEKITEIIMIASTLELNEEDGAFLTSFCNSFSQLSNTCMRNANKVVKTKVVTID